MAKPRKANLGQCLRALAARVRRKVVPWDPEWRRGRGERRVELPRRGERAARARAAEEAVARHLWTQGYQVVARNLRNRYGELDIVAALDGRLHFIEVRSYVEGKPRPSALLSAAKRASLFRAAHAYRRRRPDAAGHGMIIEIAEVCFGADGRQKGIRICPLDYTRRH